MAIDTIEEAASEHRWEDAVLSLCNGLAALHPQRRLAVATEVVELCETMKLLMTLPSTVKSNERPERLQLSSEVQPSDLEPVEVQLESAREILAELETSQKKRDPQDILKLASAIFALQILVWLRGNPDAGKNGGKIRFRATGYTTIPWPTRSAYLFGLMCAG